MKNLSGKKKILVIGGGFAGIRVIKKAGKDLFEILLIDKVNHHQFQPLFYQVASSQIEPSSISFPFRYIFRKRKNVNVRLAEVLAIDKAGNKVSTTIGDFPYDILILCIGCKTNFFGNKKIEESALSLKSTTDAIAIRNHILQTFENILSAPEKEKEGLFNFVIVGGGPTGVELAGAFAEIKKNILSEDYREIDFTKFRIIMIEGSKHTLNSMSDTAKTASRKYLEEMGVIIHTEKMVKDYDGNVLTLTSGETIKTKTLIWAAGVTANSIKGFAPEQIVHGGRLKVDRMNKVQGSENIFAVGDIALMPTPKYPKGHPQLASVAIQQATNVAKNLKRVAHKKPPVEFEYKDRGSMATIGRNKAVVDLPYWHFSGYFAWLAWMFTHLMLIMIAKNRLIIFIHWTWEYITKNTTLGLIFTREKKDS